MSLTIDEDLLNQAMEVFNTRIKREAIELAIREALGAKRRAKLLEHAGKIDLGMEQEDLERLREYGYSCRFPNPAFFPNCATISERPSAGSTDLFNIRYTVSQIGSRTFALFVSI